MPRLLSVTVRDLDEGVVNAFHALVALAPWTQWPRMSQYIQVQFPVPVGAMHLASKGEQTAGSKERAACAVGRAAAAARRARSFIVAMAVFWFWKWLRRICLYARVGMRGEGRPDTQVLKPLTYTRTGRCVAPVGKFSTECRLPYKQGEIRTSRRAAAASAPCPLSSIASSHQTPNLPLSSAPTDATITEQ